MRTSRQEQHTIVPVALAWFVHALTASGAFLAFLAFAAIEQGAFRLAMLWLFAALLVDGVDGPLARKMHVRRRLPHIDGPTLDLVVDYLTYVFLPTILIYRAGLMPGWFELCGAALIQLSALYHFARTDSKSVDNYFVGFPALWNVVAFYLLMIGPGPEIGALVVCVFAALTFVPLYVVHPVRVRTFQPWLALLSVAWTAVSVALLWPYWSPRMEHAWLGLSLAGAAGLLGVGVMRTLRGPTLVVTATASVPAPSRG